MGNMTYTISHMWYDSRDVYVYGMVGLLYGRAIQHGTAQYSMVQHGTAQYSMVQHGTTW